MSAFRHTPSSGFSTSLSNPISKKVLFYLPTSSPLLLSTPLILGIVESDSYDLHLWAPLMLSSLLEVPYFGIRPMFLNLQRCQQERLSAKVVQQFGLRMRNRTPSHSESNQPRIPKITRRMDVSKLSLVSVVSQNQTPITS